MPHPTYPSTALIAVALSLAGCGPPARPDVIITLDGARHACVVALYSEPQGSAVPCAEVVPFVRDELRVASGSTYDIRTLAQADDAERTNVEAGLKAAGYRLIGSR